MSDKFDPIGFIKDTEEMIRIKVKKLTKDKTIREDLKRVQQSGYQIPPGKHLYLRMAMDFSDAQEVKDKLEDKVADSITANQITVKNLNHETDLENFMILYNEIFMAAPDPSRDLSIEEVKNFSEESTFIAYLGSTMTGFVFITIEPDSEDATQLVGAIAGIGVLGRYRGKKIGLKLLSKSIEYLQDKNTSKLICEVYEKNEASRKMFEGMGMTVVGYMILEDEFKGAEQSET
jgi:ribosomal protein S18 acetylase RimI-like enzyme